MAAIGVSPISAFDLARKILSDSSLTWDWGERPMKRLLYDLGRDFCVSCRRKGLDADVQEWLLDLVWTDRSTRDVRLAVESEWSHVMAHRLDDFEKLMSVKSVLKLFIYETRSPNESDEVRRELARYLDAFTQHLEGEEYLLMDIRGQLADFYRYSVPNTGSVPPVTFAPLQVESSASATN